MLPDVFYGTGTYDGLKKRLEVGFEAKDQLDLSTQLDFSVDLFLKVFPQAGGPKVRYPKTVNGAQFIIDMTQ